jgi:hypothetical protein
MADAATTSAPQAMPVHSTPEGTGTNAARHRAWLNEIGRLLVSHSLLISVVNKNSLQSRRPADDVVGIDPTHALTWILEKCDTASINLPPRVAIYMQSVLQQVFPRFFLDVAYLS